MSNPANGRRSVRQDDLAFCAGLLSEAEVADLRRFNGAIEYGPTNMTPEEHREMLHWSRVARQG